MSKFERNFSIALARVGDPNANIEYCLAPLSEFVLKPVSGLAKLYQEQAGKEWPELCAKATLVRQAVKELFNASENVNRRKKAEELAEYLKTAAMPDASPYMKDLGFTSLASYADWAWKNLD